MPCAGIANFASPREWTITSPNQFAMRTWRPHSSARDFRGPDSVKHVRRSCRRSWSGGEIGRRGERTEAGNDVTPKGLGSFRQQYAALGRFGFACDAIFFCDLCEVVEIVEK